MGSVQLGTTIVKFVALAFIATVGLFYIKSANFTPWNVSGESAIGAIGGGMAIALFSYLGVECAAVAAAKVRNPDRNIPRATILGTIATAVVYMLSLTAVFGIVPSTVLASAAMIINYLGSSGATVFTTLVLMTGITAAIPYAFSALAQLKWRWTDHRTLETPRFARDMIVAVLSLVFSILFIWYSRNTGHSFWVYWAPFFLAGGALLLGIPVYLGQRRHMSDPAPV